MDAEYRFYPGDMFRMAVRTAPELDADLTIAPDGRVTLPLLGPTLVAGRSLSEVQALLEDRYASELLDPSLEVTPVEFGSQRIFVGGEVRTPGVYDLPGSIDTLQAILLAGGWTEDGKPAEVIVMRRAPGGALMTRAVNVRKGISRATLGEIGPLQRFDVVYVSRKAIADENLFVQQFVRDALPINFSLFYDIAQF